MTAASLIFVNMPEHFWSLLCAVGVVCIAWFLSRWAWIRLSLRSLLDVVACACRHDGYKRAALGSPRYDACGDRVQAECQNILRQHLSYRNASGRRSRIW